MSLTMKYIQYFMKIGLIEMSQKSKAKIYLTFGEKKKKKCRNLEKNSFKITFPKIL